MTCPLTKTAISTKLSLIIGSIDQLIQTKQRFIKLYYLDGWIQIVQVDEQTIMLQFNEPLDLFCFVHANFLKTQTNRWMMIGMLLS